MITLLATTGGIIGLLELFLVAILVLAIIAGLIWAIERWISPIPSEVKLVLAIVIVILVVIFALRQFGAT